MDFNAAARSQPAQQGASGMRDAIEGTLDHWLPAAERLDFGAELLTLDTIIRPSMTAVALASTRGLSRCPALVSQLEGQAITHRHPPVSPSDTDRRENDAHSQLEAAGGRGGR